MMNSIYSISNNLIAQTQAPAAPATGTAGKKQGLMDMLFPFFLIGIIFYFFILRPQRKRQQKQDLFLNALKRGDSVVTTGGIIGKIFGVTDTVVVLDLGNNQKLRVLKSHVSGFDESEGPAAKTKTA